MCVSCCSARTVPSAPYAPSLVVFLNQYLPCPVYPRICYQQRACVFLLPAAWTCSMPFHWVSFPSLSLEPSVISSLPSAPMWRVRLGLQCSAAGWGILLCFFPDAPNRFSAVLCVLCFACRGNRGLTLLEQCSCFIPGSEVSHQWSRLMPAAGALLARCSPLNTPEIKSSEEQLDRGLSTPWLVLGMTGNALC